MLKWLLENLKLIGGAVGGVVAIFSGYFYFDGPVPASKKYVIAQVNDIKSSLIDNSIQILRQNKEQLYDKKDDKELKAARETNEEVKTIYKRQLQGINDSISDIDRQTRDLEAEKRKLQGK